MPTPIRFFNDGAVSYPYLSDGMWFLTQFRRWGLLKTAPDYAAIAARINQTSVWQDAATAVGGISAPSSPVRSSTLMDGTVWNGTDPEGYANRFAIHTVKGPDYEASDKTPDMLKRSHRVGK